MTAPAIHRRRSRVLSCQQVVEGARCGKKAVGMTERCVMVCAEHAVGVHVQAFGVQR
mgnify:FL=1